MFASLPEYSPSLIGLVRALDAAEMAVRSADWHFGDLEMWQPELMANPEDVPGWTQQNIAGLKASLPALRALFRNMVEAETKGLEIEANLLGDACAPPLVLAVFEPIEAAVIKHRPPAEISISALQTLPDSVSDAVGRNRAIYWDGEVYVIPSEVPSSFVEVWFRRSLGYWDDGGAYPARLVQRDYGWQAFGIER